jgi:dihydroorotase|tara:strand:+ start:617 stop:1870 length:1254 start_codon:yes stop_codon:yes gene_type:complete
MKILLKNATVIDNNSPLHCKTLSLLIEDGIIKQIDEKINIKSDLIIERDNLHISRGWFDPSVSFGEPGYEERETLDNGLKVAAKSGFTSIGLNSDLIPYSDNHSSVNHLINKSKGYTTSLYPIGNLSESAKGKKLASLYDIKKAGAIYFGDYKKSTENGNLVKIALEYSQTFDGIICSYPLDKNLSQNGIVNEGITSLSHGLRGISKIAETTRLLRDINILEYTGGKLHFSHITTKESVKIIENAKKSGLNVSCSVGLPHLLFTDKEIENFNPNYKFLPPLRSNEDLQSLRSGVLSGVIDCVTSMHEPKNIEIKNLDFNLAADGSVALEAFFPLLNSIFPIEKTIQILNRGKVIFKIKNESIEVGNTANLTMFDPSVSGEIKAKDILSTSKNCTYLNQNIKGYVFGCINNSILTFNE